MRFRHGDDGGAVGGMADGNIHSILAETFQQFREPRKLPVRIGSIPAVGRGEMRENAFDVHTAQIHDRPDLLQWIIGRDSCRQIRRHDSQATHAGVDFDMEFDPAPVLPGRG